jgi:hypothetical protein
VSGQTDTLAPELEHHPKYRLPTGEPLRLDGMSRPRAEALGALVVWCQVSAVARLRYAGGSGRTAAERAKGREIGHLLIDFADAAEAGLLDRYVGAKNGGAWGRSDPPGPTIGALWRSFDRLNTLAHPWRSVDTYPPRGVEEPASAAYLRSLGLDPEHALSHVTGDDVRAALLAYGLPERAHLAQLRSIGRARLDLARVVPGEHRLTTEEDEARVCEMVLAWGIGV